jgi:hypothetical protein
MCLPEEYQSKSNPGNVIPSRLMRNLLRAMNLYLTEPECTDLLTILDPHSLGSFHVSGLCESLINLMTGSL